MSMQEAKRLLAELQPPSKSTMSSDVKRYVALRRKGNKAP